MVNLAAAAGGVLTRPPPPPHRPRCARGAAQPGTHMQSCWRARQGAWDAKQEAPGTSFWRAYMHDCRQTSPPPKALGFAYFARSLPHTTTSKARAGAIAQWVLFATLRCHALWSMLVYNVSQVCVLIGTTSLLGRVDAEVSPRPPDTAPAAAPSPLAARREFTPNQMCHVRLLKLAKAARPGCYCSPVLPLAPSMARRFSCASSSTAGSTCRQWCMDSLACCMPTSTSSSALLKPLSNPGSDLAAADAPLAAIQGVWDKQARSMVQPASPRVECCRAQGCRARAQQ